MTTSRTKSALKMPKDTGEVGDLLTTYSKSDSREREITAKMEQRIQKIRDEYQEELQELAEEKSNAFSRVQMWAEANDDNFQEKRSMDFANASIGFRTGMPKLKLKVKSWDVAIEKLKKFLPDYVRTKEEAAKDMLIADRDKADVKGQFTNCGIVVEQEETFFITVKQEEAVS